MSTGDFSSSASADGTPAVCAVIVTFNRLPLLQAAVAALRSQTTPLSRILIVDNGSTDGTPAWLATEAAGDPSFQIFTQPNRGSADGFASGLREALRDEADWLWCMDDDTVPEPDCLEHMLSAAGRFQRDQPGARVGFVNSIIRWTDGALHKMNEPRLEPFLQWPASVPASGYLPARWCSYVSLLLARDAVVEAGLPLREMFIWYDDVEFTERISQRGFRGLVALESFAEHRTKLNYAPDVEDIDDTNIGRFRYAFRNEVVFERTICAGRRGSFVLRFVRIMARRVRLMISAKKWRYLPDAIIEGVRGLSFPRDLEFPPASAPRPLAAAPLARPLS